MEDEMRQSDSDESMNTELLIKTEFVEIGPGEHAEVTTLEPDVRIKEERDKEDPLAVENCSPTEVEASAVTPRLCHVLLDRTQADEYVDEESDANNPEFSSEDMYTDYDSPNPVWRIEMPTESADSDYEPEPEVPRKKQTRKKKTRKEYECEFCPRTFKIEHSYLEHIKIHPELQEKTCRFCKLRFINHKYLLRHIRSDHKEDTRQERIEKQQRKLENKHQNVQCEICSKEFHGNSKLRLHMLVHTNYRRFVCDICEKSFKRQHHLKNHKLNVHLKTRSFSCSDCDKLFRSKGTLTEHQKLTHNNINFMKESKKCYKCNKSFHNKLVLEKHLEKLERTGICCREIKEKRSDGKPRCFCNKIFKNKKDMELHIFNEHKKQNNQYICTECNKKFISFDYFKLHLIKFHNNVKYYFCDYCKNILNSWKSLCSHYKLYHELRLSDDHFYTCDFCREKFPVKETLKMHIRFSHLVTKTFSCASCGTWFNTCKGLKEHAKRRHIIKYKCNLCFEIFKTKSDLNKHEINKHDIKIDVCKLECTGCDKKFESQSYLDLHKLLMHKVQN